MIVGDGGQVTPTPTPTPTPTVTPTPTPGGSYSLNPTADSYTYGGSAATNYGTAVDLIVKDGFGTTYDRVSYLKFNLSGVAGTISSAWLRLYCHGLSNGAPSTAKCFTVADDSWTETGMTWNNAPALGGQVGSTLNVGTINTWYEVDILSFVVTEYNGNKVVTIAVKDDTQVNKMIDFDSREATNKPVLEITTV